MTNPEDTSIVKNNKEENKNPTPPSNKTVTEKGGETDALTQRLDEIETGLKADLEESQKEVKSLREEIKTANQRNNQPQDEIVDATRRSAHITQLPIIEGAPVIKSKISAIIGVKGLEMTAEVTNAEGDEFTLPFGCDVTKLDFDQEKTKDLYTTSYENLKSEKFELINIDPNDLTGASKVEKGVVVSDGALIPEIDRSSGTPMATGRKIRTTVKKDVRHYTIAFKGKEFTFTNADLANIRI